MRLLTAKFLVAASLAFTGTSSAASGEQCLNGLGPALMSGGFSGSIDCHRDQLSFKHVGHVQNFGRTFEIYSNVYRLKPACPECAVHGGHRIILMERGRYVGQYRSDFSRIAIRKGQLVLIRTDIKGAHPQTVEFTAKGPPRTFWDGGEVLSFFR